ncbi:NAD(P)/FAD-dependent oxidoreductase [Halotalea alkalilenta]|uniref:NADH dehydrogenase n=1 Tax=Halotalea alkalilenta TaxID=376489 RepID=A0A172YHP4_9GAMM|nr:NAD(P)/FAD-dependent oxidoreductase [Halotalea alkalilenta]ANF58770.1 NADH dehydrogenase [Halotalea alkalilenta]
MSLPRIVVVGGGAGGIELVTRLGRKLGKRRKAEIVLVDRNPTHIWKPLLHEVAVGAIDTDMDQVSYQSHSRANGYRFQLGSLSGLDRQRQRLTLAPIEDERGRVLLSERSLDYDYLVLALGSVSNDFGTPGVKENCFFLDSPQQAENFRRAMLDTFLRYSGMHADEDKDLTIAIVGAGATGVELSAELFNAIEMLNAYNATDLPRSRLKVHLIEAAERILPVLSERISSSVRRQLEALGVKIHTSTQVSRADEHGFETADGQRIDADLTVWAAGVRGPELLSTLGLSTRPNHQIKVESSMVSIDDPRIFAIGDCAACPQPNDKLVPPRAQAAHQMSSHLARGLQGLLEGRELKPFEYRDMGSLVSLSRFQAVGSLMRGASARGLFVEGWLAKISYASLYRMHQLAIYGAPRTAAKILVDRLNRWLRPRLKLH